MIRLDLDLVFERFLCVCLSVWVNDKDRFLDDRWDFYVGGDNFNIDVFLIYGIVCLWCFVMMFILFIVVFYGVILD